jgi:regulator of RNase E activity RraA
MSDANMLTVEAMGPALTTALVCDALDALGFSHQSPRVSLRPLTVETVIVGRCRTMLWADMFHVDPAPYEKELLAVDACRSGDVIVAAAGGSERSGIWGELLSTAAKVRGCRGAIVDGAVRDVARMKSLPFPVFARGTSPYDSKDRQRVIDFDVRIEIDGVSFHPGELVIADWDGVVVVPGEVEEEAVRRAWEKSQDENRVRAAIEAGASAGEAYRRFGVL